MDATPLLEPGLHNFELGEIGNHFLQDFPTSNTRPSLIQNLSTYIDYLSNIGVPIELWIDGSFTTQKIDPNDIDLVIFSPAAILNELPEEKQKNFQVLTDRETIKQEFGLDVLFCPAEDENMRSYWRGWYGYNRNEQPKGIARIMVNK
ncbi:DUF6932 family protein [Sulfurimonas marina]|uniref:Nucleotidyltransferase domain-containing protein n=1 Tax=Sulfurimonas marina TaxID=2590551 RepID=A0A7M1ATL3_9BACT|nr:hypothetical protein [Sulfurimonas marina]QOP40765.1 hypothetical protein FJR03_03015 [Sulfurimonas marina]